MMALKALVRFAALAACAASLSGCISLFPKSDPVQLYRFDATAPASRATPAGERVGVLKLTTNFARPVAGDRILGVTGDKAAFIADSRWVAPAAILFDEAVARVFDGDAGAVRLITRGEAGKAAYSLRLDVRNFEALYLDGAKAAPTVVVKLRAVLIRANDRTLAGEKIFEVRVRAGDNRVGEIVTAFNQAVGQVLSELVAWTDLTATPAPG